MRGLAVRPSFIERSAGPRPEPPRARQHATTVEAVELAGSPKRTTPTD